MKRKIYSLIMTMACVMMFTCMTTQAAEVTEESLRDLYLEVTYPVDDTNYTKESYDSYENALDCGEVILHKANATEEEITDALESIYDSKDMLEYNEVSISVSSNKDTFEDYTLDKMLDGNSSTKSFIKDNQEVGDYIKFSFSKPVSLKSFRILFSKGENYIYKAILETSVDNEAWSKFAIMNNTTNMVLNQIFIGDNSKVQYFRIKITTPVERYTQISEVYFTYDPDVERSVALSRLNFNLTRAYKLNVSNYTEENLALLETAIKNAEDILSAELVSSGVIDATNNALKGCMNSTRKNTEVCDVFADINHGAWHEDCIQYVYDNDIMSGSNGLFKPNNNITRAQFVTTLYRLAGAPKVTDYRACENFSDVSEGEWYTDAICWAYNEKVAYGNHTSKFNPSEFLTRQQMVVLLYRFANIFGLDTALDDYSKDVILVNADLVYAYAKEPVQWAVDKGLISGSQIIDTNGNVTYDLNPRGNTTRAQVASILQRFCEKN